jgi:hypothetical protein
MHACHVFTAWNHDSVRDESSFVTRCARETKESGAVDDALMATMAGSAEALKRGARLAGGARRGSPL